MRLPKHFIQKIPLFTFAAEYHYNKCSYSQLSLLFDITDAIRKTRRRKNLRLQNAVARMDEAGEIEKLKNLLHQRLQESGWRDQVKEQCKDIVRAKGSKVTVDDLVHGITPKAKDLMPDEIKRELMQKIRSYLDPKSPRAI